MSGEACPEGTVPIRRTSEADMLRASSFQMFGKKVSRHLTTDDSGIAHEVTRRDLAIEVEQRLVHLKHFLYFLSNLREIIIISFQFKNLLSSKFQ